MGKLMELADKDANYKYAPYAQKCGGKHEHNKEQNGRFLENELIQMKTDHLK